MLISPKYPNPGRIILDPPDLLHYFRSIVYALFTQFTQNTFDNLSNYGNLRALIDSIHPVHLFDTTINLMNWVIIHGL